MTSAFGGMRFLFMDLLEIINRLPAHMPLTDDFERRMANGQVSKAWYSSQKEHWQNWLLWYDTEGPYGRKPMPNAPAKLVWGRVQSPGMLAWLAEASGLDTKTLRRTLRPKATMKNAQICKLIREAAPWPAVELKLRGLQ